MPREFKVLSGTGGQEERTYEVVLPEQQKHFRNVNSSLLQDALDTWGDIWDELQGSVTSGTMLLPSDGKGLQPKCGWPEFLEKMWVLRHYLEHAKRFCEKGN